MSSQPPVQATQPSSAPPAPPVPATTKADGVPDPENQNPYGKNNEQLPEDLQKALRDLTCSLTRDGFTTRRKEVANSKKAREFWRGEQYLYWSESDGVWKAPSSALLASSPNEDPPFQFVTNMYRGNGMQYAAVITNSPPRLKFWPQRPREKSDLDTAKAADQVAGLIERNNRIADKLFDLAYFTWNDPYIGAYVRYVVDGERFGYDEIPIMEPQEQQISPDQFQCAQCGATQPHDGTVGPDGLPTPASPVCQGQSPTTPGQPCGAPMGPENFAPAVTAQVPVQTGTKKEPRGQEVIDFVGTLELRIPSYNQQMSDYAYLTYEIEQHSSKLKALYPQAADRIPQAFVGTDATGDLNEREARRRTKTGVEGESYGQLITFTRTWIRPWAFYSCEPEIRDQLLKIFPNGAYVAFAGTTYCESRNESMDDHWRVRAIVPGNTSVGHDVISLQERLNTLMNIEMETYEHGIPVTFMEASAMNAEAYKNSPPRPGYITPIQGRPGLPIGAQVQTQQAGQVSPQAVEHARDLMGPVAQFISGLFPALFGGGNIGNDTASGYAMQRDQAMGRIGLLYRRIKEFYSDVMLLSIDTFKKNRKQDVDIAVEGKGAQLDVQTIHIEDLQGMIYAYPEVDEDFPASWTQKKNATMDFLQIPNPALQAIWTAPAMAAALGRLTGLGDDMPIPGVEARAKQFREIALMIQQEPTQPQPDPTTGAPPVDPMTGAPAMPQSSVPVDQVLDDHANEFAACVEWAQSDEGQTMRLQNPLAYENVRLHAQQHQMFMAPPPAPPGPGGEPDQDDSKK